MFREIYIDIDTECLNRGRNLARRTARFLEVIESREWKLISVFHSIGFFLCFSFRFKKKLYHEYNEIYLFMYRYAKEYGTTICIMYV